VRKIDAPTLAEWLIFTAACAALIGFDIHGPAGKWHAAISWTAGVAAGMELFPRQRLSSVLFWLLWLVFLAAHIFAMWFLFGVLFPNLRLGTLYVYLPSMLEGLFLGAVVWILGNRLDRRIRGKAPRKSAARP